MAKQNDPAGIELPLTCGLHSNRLLIDSVLLCTTLCIEGLDFSNATSDLIGYRRINANTSELLLKYNIIIKVNQSKMLRKKVLRNVLQDKVLCKVIMDYFRFKRSKLKYKMYFHSQST